MFKPSSSQVLLASIALASFEAHAIMTDTQEDSTSYGANVPQDVITLITHGYKDNSYNIDIKQAKEDDEKSLEIHKMASDCNIGHDQIPRQQYHGYYQHSSINRGSHAHAIRSNSPQPLSRRGAM
ncbi:hypothetical protein BGW39_003341 [Mortierella sp. 14UC]|nr:hypothetical protein BGW39_003341 [Mortierella sp. 14UC]